MDCLEEALPALRKVVLSDELSSDAAGNTLQRFFMMGEFLKSESGYGELPELWPDSEGE